MFDVSLNQKKIAATSFCDPNVFPKTFDIYVCIKDAEDNLVAIKIKHNFLMKLKLVANI